VLGNKPVIPSKLTKMAIGTSLLIIVFNSVAGFLGYLGQVSLNWNLMFSFIVAASAGTIFGAYLAEFVPASRLQKSFGYFLLAVGALVLVQNHRHPQSSNRENHSTARMIERHFQD
jgi:uncharacterized membrane protein YfcA